MTDTDVRDALTRATDHLSPAPDLLDRVRSGGRRRVVRRRAVLGGAFAVAAAGGLVPALRHEGAGVPAAGRRGAPGDLGNDRELLERVRQAWRAVHGPGEVEVHWAGSTPAGPVAVVTQPSTEAGLSFQGFVESAGGRLRAHAGRLTTDPGTVSPAAFLAGPARDVLVAFTAGRTLSYSADFKIDSAGRVVRDFVRLTDSDGDGAVIRRVTPPEHDTRFALRRDGEPASQVPLVNIEAAIDGTRDLHGVPVNLERSVPGHERAWPAVLTQAESDRWDVGKRQGFTDPYGFSAFEGPTQWRLTGATADGRRLVVQTLALQGRGHAYWMAGRAGETPVVHYLGSPAAGIAAKVKGKDVAALPVLYLRLPGELGVAVAALGCILRYRVRGGGWLLLSSEAALLPPAATELEVRPTGRIPSHFSLP